MDIIKERLSREYDMETLFTIPTVTYLVKAKYFKHPRIVSGMNVKELIVSGLYKEVLKHIGVEIKTLQEILGNSHETKSNNEVLVEYYAEVLKPWMIVKSGGDMLDQ